MMKNTFAFPLSFAQRRFWLLDQLEPGDPTYNIAVAVRLRGPLAGKILGQSLQKVVRRHESLRTTFRTIDNEVFQFVLPDVGLDLEFIAANPSDSRDAEQKILAHAAAIAQHRFNLAQGPLLQALLLELSSEDHVLYLAIHHIVSDGWSVMVLIREVVELYTAYASGGQSSLPALPIQYADFSQWQGECVNGPWLKTEVDYWKEKLADLPVLDLPTDYARPAVQRHLGAKQSLLLSEDLSKSLNELGRAQNASLYMVLLAAFKILLRKHSGSNDIVVGSPVSGRDQFEVEGLIGCFLNTLVLRTVIQQAQCFLDVLQQVREVTLEGYSHQEIPFEKILQEINPERGLSRAPMFQVFFNMINLPAALEVEIPGVTAEMIELPEHHSKFDLTLYVEQKHGRIRFDLVYDAELFSEERMREWLEQFEFLLHQIAAQPEKKIEELSLVTSTARSILPNPKDVLDARWLGAVHDLFRATASRNPQSPAVCDGDVQWSYRELDELSDRLANCLLSCGLRRQEIVAVYGHRSAPLVLSLFAVMKAGGAFLILDPGYPAARLATYLEIARPKAFLQIAPAGALPQTLEQALDEVGCDFKFSLPGSSGEQLARVLSEYSTTAPAISIEADQLAYISFTSGSTGKPKAVMGKHGSLSHFIPWLKEKFSLNENDRFSLFSALSHDPLHRDVFTPLILGACVYIPNSKVLMSSDAATAWILSNKITVSHLTPAMGQLLRSDSERPEQLLESLRHIFFVGDVLTRQDVSEIQKLAPNATVVNYYGATETQRAVSYLEIPPSYLVRELTGMGIVPEIFTGTGISKHGANITAGTVSDIVGRLPGTANSQAIMLVAHYDSVSRGPGAADDGSGVACILETVRALRTVAPLKNDIIVLLTDGEEPGLLGADAFTTDSHPSLKNVGLILNFEARGDRGPSLLFETSDHNALLMNEVAKAASHPVASSLFYSLYKTLPNDTDFTVFRRTETPGLNFAFGGGLKAYHSRLDTTENLSLASLQHHGSYALSLSKHFGQMDLTMLRQNAEDAVFFDWFGDRLLVYRQSLVIPGEFLVTVLIAFVVMIELRRAETKPMRLLLSVLAEMVFLILVPAVTAAAWWIIASLLGARRPTSDSPANALLLTGLVLLASVVAMLWFSFLRKKFAIQTLLLAALLLFCCLSWPLAIMLPAGSYLFFWPLLLMIVGILCIELLNKGADPVAQFIATFPGIAAAAFLFTPVVYLIYIFLTLQFSVVIAAGFFTGLTFMIASAQLAFATDQRLWWKELFLLAAALICLTAGANLAHYGPDYPKQDTVFYSMNDDDHTAQWISDDRRLDKWTAQFFPEKSAPSQPMPNYLMGDTDPVFAAPAPMLPLPAPVVQIETDKTIGDLRVLHLTIQSRRGAPMTHLVFADDVQCAAATIAGRSIPFRRNSKGLRLTLYAISNQKVDVELQIKAAAGSYFWVMDESYGLPFTSHPRPDDLVPSPNSDVTLISRKYTLMSGAS